MTADERAAAERRARFGTLPERVAFADLVQEQPPAARPGAGYDPDAQAVRFACLAADLGL
ncbi:hypothetical protein ACIQF6_01015 [Kitasatospora sp. NPDC092948]|uniref:hypothetical protein n=1 Tax=Kitasatospora sp. NPDC092948 TaxID=3364088 RepID=UPI00380C9986